MAGFSVLELVVIIAVVASLSAVIITQVTDFADTAQTASDNRNMQVWNSTYRQALAANPNIPDATWAEASNTLSSGVNVSVGENTVVTYRAAKPSWSRPGDPTFVEGTGIISPP